MWTVLKYVELMWFLKAPGVDTQAVTVLDDDLRGS